MVVHLYESFTIAVTPGPGGSGSTLQVYETDDDGNFTGDKHVLMLSEDATKEVHKQLGEVMGAKVEVANIQDMKRETSGVPKPQPRR